MNQYRRLVQVILKDYPDLTFVPKMYVNKDYWVTKISVPLEDVDINIELDDRPDEHYWGCLQYDETSKTGIDFCVYQPEEVGDTPSLCFYPVVGDEIDTTEEIQLECEIINNF